MDSQEVTNHKNATRFETWIKVNTKADFTGTKTAKEVVSGMYFSLH